MIRGIFVGLMWVFAVLGAVASLVFALNALGFVLNAAGPRDNSDPPDGISGMDIKTDHLTGCQYLSRRGLTPRLDGQGRHVGCR